MTPGHSLSVVIPVFRAGSILESVCREILDACSDVSPAASLKVTLEEIILVCDNPNLPDEVRHHVESLPQLDNRIRVVWLARNFGQHPATVAGIVSSNGDWVVTMDEDGQHDPRFIRELLATAGHGLTPLVYAAPTNARPHGTLRNGASWIAARTSRALSGSSVRFHSFRLLEGGLARSACAYAGENVFLDVALGWTFGRAGTCPVELRKEPIDSSYNFRRLLSHFWRQVLSSGTRPLRAIAAAGLVVALMGCLIGAYVIARRLSGTPIEPGWASVFVSLLILVGGLFVAVAVLAEYVGQAVRNTIGRPVYVRTDPPEARALHELRRHLLGSEGAGQST